jgi:hypothetical protein
MRRRGRIEGLKLSINPRCRILPLVAPEEADSASRDPSNSEWGGRQYELVRMFEWNGSWWFFWRVQPTETHVT